MGKGKLRSTTGRDALNKSSWGAISFVFFLSLFLHARSFFIFSVSVLAMHSKWICWHLIRAHPRERQCFPRYTWNRAARPACNSRKPVFIIYAPPFYMHWKYFMVSTLAVALIHLSLLYTHKKPQPPHHKSLLFLVYSVCAHHLAGCWLLPLYHLH